MYNPSDNIVDRWLERAGQWIAHQVAEAVLWISEQVSRLLLYTGFEFLKSDAFLSVYGMIVTITDLAFILILAYYSFQCTIGNKEIRSVVSLVVKLFLASLCYHNLPYFAYHVIKFFNELSSNILSLRVDVTSLPINGIVLIIFLVIYGYMAYKLVFYFAYRNFAILSIVALAPLFFTAWACERKSMYTTVFTKIKGMLFSQVIHSLQLVILSYTTVGIGEYATGLSAILLQIGAIAVMLEVPSWFEGYTPAMPKMPWVKEQGKKAGKGLLEIGKSFFKSDRNARRSS